MTHSPTPQDLLNASAALAATRDGALDLDHSRSATAMDTVGRAVAAAAHTLHPDTVLTWDDSDNAVLGHLVARESGIPVVPFRVQDGVIDVDAEAVHGRRVVLVTLHGVPPLRLRQVRAFLDTHRATLDGVVEAVGAPGAPDATTPHLVLVDQRDLVPTGPSGTDHAH